MSSITVTVLTPHGRRQNVQVTPQMTLLQILEEVCKKYEFKCEEYGLKHHNKELDLTQMFRFSGLPNKCLLEMNECNKKREDSEVVICIQLENGIRHQGQFFPNQTLKDVLQQLVPNYLDDTYHPIIVYMRVEIYGNSLEKTTLKSLGIIKGRAMFRLFNKNPEDLKSQANVYIPSVKPMNNVSENEGSTSKSESQNMSTNKTDEKKKLGITTNKIRDLISKKDKKDEDKSMNEKEKEDEIKKNEKMDEELQTSKKPEYDWGSSVGRTINEGIVAPTEIEEEDEEMIEEPDIFVLGERNAVVFSLNSAQKVADDIPDSFFDLTIDDLKILLRDLRKEASGNEDAPLLTAKLREIEDNSRQLRKLSQYKKSVIRIQFPDRMVLQGTFSPIDKVQDIYEFVKSYLKDPNLNFCLFTIPPKKILPKDVTLLEVDCIPTAILHFGVEENNQDERKSFLKDELQETSATGAILAASKSRGLTAIQQQYRQKQEIAVEEVAGPSSSSDRKKPTQSTGAIPKQPKSFKSSSVTQESSEKVPKWFRTNK